MINRVTGMYSGFDTDELVKGLVSPIQSKIDNADRQKQYAVWQQDAYREVITDLRSFESKFFDVLNKEHYICSKSSFNSYVATVENSTAVSAVATGTVIPVEHTLSDITMANKDTWKSGAISELTGSGIDIDSLSTGDDFGIQLDGAMKRIVLDGNYSDVDELVVDLQSKIDVAFGAGNITVSNASGEIDFSSPGHKVMLQNTYNLDAEAYNTTLENMGFLSGDKNVLDTSKTLGETNFKGDIFQGGEAIRFSINGIGFSFDKDTDTMEDVLTAINKSEANVNLYYSQLTDTFVLESKEEGVMNKISFQDYTGSFFGNGLSMNHASDTGHILEGRDATFTIDGVATRRSTNDFTIDGMMYTLNESTMDEVKISVSTDTASTKDTIVTFVGAYNDLVEKWGGLINEERYSDFTPLTDEEKEAMSETEIKLWEGKAKSGILRSDDTLEKVVRDFRSILMSYESKLGISLSQIGINTSSDIDERGKLIIDEEALDTALQDRPEEIMNLFTDTELGIGAKMEAVIDYAISTTGEKGMLLQKAGWEGTTTETENMLSKKITEYDTLIADLLDKLADAEQKYYNQFGYMEKVLANLTSQSSWLTNQLE